MEAKCISLKVFKILMMLSLEWSLKTKANPGITSLGKTIPRTKHDFILLIIICTIIGRSLANKSQP